MLKGLPLAYNKDLQEDQEPLFDAVGTLRDASVLAGMVASLGERGADGAAAAALLLATDLAEPW